MLILAISFYFQQQLEAIDYTGAYVSLHLALETIIEYGSHNLFNDEETLSQGPEKY